MRSALVGLIVCLASVSSVYADVSFVSDPIWLSANRVTEGRPVQVSTVVTKTGSESINGTVTFYAGETALGSADFALPSSVSGTVVSVSWTPAAGEYPISARITRADIEGGDSALDLSTALFVPGSLVVEPDADRDGAADASDDDDDNDGVSDIDEIARGTDMFVPDRASTPIPTVAGASTSASEILETVKENAQTFGSTAFTVSESLREKAAGFVDAKLAQMDDEKQLGGETDDETIVVATPKTFMEQVQDLPHVARTAKRYAYAFLSFVFNNWYVFYLVIFVVLLWSVRRIWQRNSLD